MNIPLRIFLRFLRKEKCFDAYIAACKEDKRLHYSDRPMLEYMHNMGIIDDNKKCSEDSITQSFDWDEFENIDNIDYDWYEISQKWKIFIKYDEEDN